MAHNVTTSMPVNSAGIISCPQHKHNLFSLGRSTSRRPGQQRPTKRQPLHRRLRTEPLEDRRLLALVMVTTPNDTVDFGDGLTSLREAIFATNQVSGADTIEFAASLTSASPATLTQAGRAGL